MTINMLKKIAGMVLGTGRHAVSVDRIRRPNRSRTFFQGLEGLDGRLAPGSIAPILVTVTNQPPTQAPTPTPTPTQTASTIIPSTPQSSIA